MKPPDTKVDTYIVCGDEDDKKYPKFKVGKQVRKSKNKNIFAKGCTQNWSEEVKNTGPWTYLVSDLNGVVKIVVISFEKELQKTRKAKSRIEKLSEKDGRLYVKCKGYDNSVKKWINMKDIV